MNTQAEHCSFKKFLPIGLFFLCLKTIGIWVLFGIAIQLVGKDIFPSIERVALAKGLLITSFCIAFVCIFGWYGSSPERRHRYIRLMLKSGAYSLDQKTWSVFKQYPQLFVLLIGAAVIAPIASLLLCFALILYGSIPLPIALFISFVLASTLWCTAFLLAGELYQRKMNPAYQSDLVSEMASNLVHAIPFILIFALAWWLFVLVSTKDDKRAGEGVFAFLGLETVKVFTYLNLASIALHDRKWKSFADTKKFLAEDSAGIVKTWAYSGASLIPLAYPLFILIAWAPLIDFSDTFIYSAFAILGLLICLFSCLQQMNFLLYLASKDNPADAQVPSSINSYVHI